MLTSLACVSTVAFTPMLRTTVGSGCVPMLRITVGSGCVPMLHTTVGSGCVPIVVVSLDRCCAVNFCTSSICTASCANTARW